MDDLVPPSAKEVNVEENLPSWEDEFGDELVDLPILEGEEFDPIGDLLLLKTLLAGTPITEANTPDKEVKDEVLTNNEIKSPRHIQNPPWTEARSYTGRYYIPHVKIGPGQTSF